MASGLKQRCAVEDLSIGMFVSSLDRPIVQSPFPLEGFYIRTRLELLWLSNYCRFVMVNITKSKLVKELNSTLKLELVETPNALHEPQGFRENKKVKAKKVIKHRQKSKAKRFLLLLLISLVFLYYFKA